MICLVFMREQFQDVAVLRLYGEIFFHEGNLKPTAIVKQTSTPTNMATVSKGAGLMEQSAGKGKSSHHALRLPPSLFYNISEFESKFPESSSLFLCLYEKLSESENIKEPLL